MAKFNIIDAAGKGYKFAWKERRMLLHYGFWPIMLKMASFSIISLMGYQKDILRQGLILLPSNFLEGWLIVIAIRFALLNETVPEPLSAKAGGASPASISARRAILGGALVFTLANHCASFLGAMLISLGQSVKPEQAHEITLEGYLATLAFLAFMIYAFRFLWLHIPIGLGIPLRPFLRRIAGLNSSVYMLALWMFCMLPFVLMLGMLNQFFLALGGSGANAVVYGQILVFFQALFEIFTAIIAGTGMAFAVREMMTPKKS